MFRSIKVALRELVPAYILGAVGCFMLLIVEPITLYAGNVDDLWFDLYDMLPEIGLMFIQYLVCVLVGLSGIYLVLKKIKKVEVFYGLVFMLFCGFLAVYIQGNFLAGSLPGLNGEKFNWREYPTEVAVSCMVWAVVFLGMVVGTVILIKKKALKTAYKYTGYVAGAIFLMLGASLVSLLVKPRVLMNKDVSVATNENYNLASNTENFFIFMVDAIDAQSFHKSLTEDEKYNERYNSIFQDFSYYPDAMSYYAYTRDSVPMIFSGKANLNEKSFGEYSMESYAGAEIFRRMQEAEYKMDFYDESIILSRETAEMFGNMSFDAKIKRTNFREQIKRYVAFKYLPMVLKGRAHIEDLYFAGTDLPKQQGRFSWSNVDNYRKISGGELELTDQKVFQFVHIEGAHVPLTMDEELKNDAGRDWNRTTDYEKKEKATFKVIESYIERIKRAGIYEQSVIVVLADHGFDAENRPEYDYIEWRYNPALYIKGRGETHTKMKVSDKAVSYLDMSEALGELLEGKKSTELFSEIGSERKREAIWYVWNKEKHMVGMETEGKAWEGEKFEKTGKVFDL